MVYGASGSYLRGAGRLGVSWGPLHFHNRALCRLNRSPCQAHPEAGGLRGRTQRVPRLGACPTFQWPRSVTSSVTLYNAR